MFYSNIITFSKKKVKIWLLQVYREPYKYAQTFDAEVNNQINEIIQQGIIKIFLLLANLDS